MELKPSHFKLLIAVAEHQSISKAAESLHISQPAVSKRILDLEKSLGIPLLDRTSRQIVPTKFGEAVIRSGKSMLAELNRIEIEIEHLKEEVRSSVVVGTFPMFAAYLVPTAVNRMLATRDDVFVHVVEDSHFHIMSELRAGNLDFVVGAFVVDLDPELVEEVLFHDRWHAIVRSNHPLVENHDLTLQELARWEWVVPPRHFPAYRQWRNVFLSAGIDPPRHRIETTSAGTVRTTLLQTDQIGYLTQQNFNLEIDAGILMPLPVELHTTSRAFGITRRARGKPAEAALDLMEHIRNVAAEVTAHRTSARFETSRRPEMLITSST